jgi:hypothetical protein
VPGRNCRPGVALAQGASHRERSGSLLTPSGKAGLRKGRRTYLRGRQRLFQAWAEAHGVHHAVARSVPEVVAVLKQWGVLDG